MNPTPAFCRIAAIFAGFFPIVSCGGTIDARIDCTEKTLVILPLSVEAEGQSLAHFNSKVGERIAKLTSGLITTHEEEAKVAESRPFKRAFKNGVPTPSALQKLCKDHHVDILVITTLTQWKLRDPHNPGMFQGQAALNVSVIDAHGSTLFQGQLVGIQFPKSLSDDPNFSLPGQSALTLNEEQVRSGLEQASARSLAELFYDHERDQP